MSAATVTDLFCGAGGSSLGAEAAGAEIVMVANHWQTAIDVHQVHFPAAAHDCADITQVDPRRYPRTNILLASPECTNHSQARGVSRKRQQPGMFDAPDPAAERSRATMWDVVRFAEQMLYDAVIVENVVEATKWVGWRAWHVAMADLGYTHRLLSHNSMHHGVPQSRDRIYVVFTRTGIDVNLEMEHAASCPRCERVTACRQSWKNGRTVGRYRQQWVWSCTACRTVVEPGVRGAVEIIDWTLDCPRIGERTKPLADKTRARILAGLQRYGWVTPIVTAGAGNTYETTPGNRAHPVTDPLPVQQTTATHALVEPFVVHPQGYSNRSRGVSEPLFTATASSPPSVAIPDSSFLMNTAHGGRLYDVAGPHPTVCASDDRLSLIMANTTNNVPHSTDEPISTVVAGTQRHALVVPLRSHMHAQPVTDAAPTVTAGGNAQTVERPVPTVPTKDRFALIDVDRLVDDCGFRMLEPQEIAAAMAFPDGYIPTNLTKKDRVKLAGNAVTPPVMQWICGRVLQALERVA